MQEGILEPSRKLPGTQTIVVHEVLLGLGSAGGLWPMGEELWRNAWFGVWGCGLGVVGLGSVEAPLCPVLSPSLPSPCICPRSLQHNPRDKMSIPWWQGTFRLFSHSCHLSTDS